MTRGSSPGSTADERAGAFVRRQPVFQSRGAVVAESFGSRFLGRHAPTGAAASRVPGARALSFADKLATPYFSSANEARKRLAGPRETAAPAVSWLFPSPWYDDVLAAQALAEAARSGAPAFGASASTAPFSSARDSRFSSPASVAAPSGLPRPRAPFTPRLQTRALSAAELITDIASGSVGAQLSRTQVTDTGAARRSPTMTALTAIAPATFAKRIARAQAETRRVPGAPSASFETLQETRARALASDPPEASSSEPAPQAEAAQTEAAQPAAQIASASQQVRAAELLAEVSQSGDYSRTLPSASAPLSMPSSLESLDRVVRLEAALAQPIVSRRASFAASLPTSPTAAPAASPTAAPSRSSAATPTAPQSPRPIVSDAPLFELVVGAEARTAIAGGASALSAARLAVAAASSSVPQALRQLAWTDRWLGRFAGASEGTLATLSGDTLDRPVPAARTLAAQSFQPVYPEVTYGPEAVQAKTSRTSRTSGAPLFSPAAPSSSTVAPAGRRPSAPAQTTAPTPTPPPAPAVPKVADDEPVSDEVFAAIAAGLARGRAQDSGDAPAERTTTPSASTLATLGTRVAPSRLAEAALADVTPWQGSGLAPALGSSPAMPALAATLSVPASPTFDVRALTQLAAVSRGVRLASSPTRPLPKEARQVATLRALAEAAPSQVFFAGELPRAANVTPASAVASAESVAKNTTNVRRSPSIGAVGQLARRFGVDRTRSAADLSFDFIEPEILAAASVYGFGPEEAARAVRLAHERDSDLAALSDSVALTFVAAVGGGAAADASTQAPQFGSAPTQPSPFSSAAPRSRVSAVAASSPASWATSSQGVASSASAIDRAAASLPAAGPAPLAADRTVARARGATLWPEAALRSLKIDPRRAAELTPQIDFALELLAAGEVADAALVAGALETFAAPDFAPLTSQRVGERGAGATVATGTAAPTDSGGSDRPGALPLVSPEASIDSGDSGPGLQSPPEGGGAQLRRAFEAIYIALTSDPAARSMAPSERAARALAVARRASAGESISAKARAALAWSVLPTVVTGGMEAALAAEVEAQQSSSALASSGGRNTFSGELTAVSSPRSPAARSRQRTVHERAPSAAPTLVQTGPTAEALREAAAAASSGSRQAAAPLPSAQTMAQAESIPTWFAEAAAHIAAESPSDSSGLSLAEMTLVRTSPKTVIAASPRGASGSSGGGATESGANRGSADGQAESPDLEGMVDELASMLRDYFEVQRMRNGD